MDVTELLHDFTEPEAAVEETLMGLAEKAAAPRWKAAGSTGNAVGIMANHQGWMAKVFLDQINGLVKELDALQKKHASILQETTD